MQFQNTALNNSEKYVNTTFGRWKQMHRLRVEGKPGGRGRGFLISRYYSPPPQPRDFSSSRRQFKIDIRRLLCQFEILYRWLKFFTHSCESKFFSVGQYIKVNIFAPANTWALWLASSCCFEVLEASFLIEKKLKGCMSSHNTSTLETSFNQKALPHLIYFGATQGTPL